MSHDNETYREVTLRIRRGSPLEAALLADAEAEGSRQLPTLARSRLAEFYGMRAGSWGQSHGKRPASGQVKQHAQAKHQRHRKNLPITPETESPHDEVANALVAGDYWN
ncbi:MAG TPA: hypothetical protein VFA10_14360 [Ktedonobacteraceae bacterium]|nr:hypothetical protein [Ktedonobacteraceae bacterium]